MRAYFICIGGAACIVGGRAVVGVGRVRRSVHHKYAAAAKHCSRKHCSAEKKHIPSAFHTATAFCRHFFHAEDRARRRNLQSYQSIYRHIYNTTKRSENQLYCRIFLLYSIVLQRFQGKHCLLKCKAGDVNIVMQCLPTLWYSICAAFRAPLILSFGGKCYVKIFQTECLYATMPRRLYVCGSSYRIHTGCVCT